MLQVRGLRLRGLREASPSNCVCLILTQSLQGEKLLSLGLFVIMTGFLSDPGISSSLQKGLGEAQVLVGSHLSSAEVPVGSETPGQW